MATETTETTDINVIINSPREITLGKRTFKVRRLLIKEIFGYLEERILNKKQKQGYEMSKLMSGDERLKFQLAVLDNLPKGKELSELLKAYITSLEGIVYLLYLASHDFDETITEEIITDLIDINDEEKLDELAPIITWISIPEDKEDPENKKKQTEQKQKK